jgi:hypothetical protein
MYIEICDICGDKLNNIFDGKYFVKRFYVDKTLLNICLLRRNL